MKTALIVTGGDIDINFTRSFLETNPYDRLIAADGALTTLFQLGLIPDYIVGDMDTAPLDVVEYYHGFPYIVWDLRSPQKDETDTELARNRAMTLNCERLLFLGATGSRIDHMLANIDSLYECLAAGKDAFLIDPRNRIRLIDSETTFNREDQWGKYISFFPFTEEVSGVTLKGFKYPLEDKSLRRGQSAGLGVSNEITDEYAVADIGEGVLICIESKD